MPVLVVEDEELLAETVSEGLLTRVLVLAEAHGATALARANEAGGLSVRVTFGRP